jgi:hypothetical protein
MEGASFEPIASIEAHGAIAYNPIRAPKCCGFGAWEVHPNKVPVEKDGVLSLEYNGEFLALGELPDDNGVSRPYRMAFCGAPHQSARSMAERVCAFKNEGAPTRVVDECGAETVSRHTFASVQKELEAAAAAARN